MEDKNANVKFSDKVETLIGSIALKVTRVGTDEVNFRILKMLPASIEEIMMETKFTKVPINIRVNLLEKVWLAKRYRGTGMVILTDFGKFFIDKIEEYEEIVGEHVIEIVKKHIDCGS